MKISFCYKLFSYKLIVVLLLYVSPLVAQEYRQEKFQILPLINAGFEDGIEPWTTSKAVLDRDICRSGKASLKLENQDPGSYELIRQKISVEPGEFLRFGGWVKGDRVSTEELWREKGAGIFIQGYSADGKYVAGEFPPTISGTFDWQEIKGMYKVPAGVSYVYFGLFIRNRNTGTAWFDDLWLQRLQAEGVAATLLYPNYRGITTSKSVHPWEVKLSRSSDRETYIKNEIKNRKGKLIYRDSIVLSSDLSQTIQWQPNGQLSPGEYTWEFEVVDFLTYEKQTFVYDISVRSKMPDVYVDKEGFTIKNGKRFFPIGIYLGEGPKSGDWASSKENLNRISAAGFNTVLSYYFGDRDAAQEYFSHTRQNKLEVVYSLKDIYDGGNNFRRIGPSAAEISAVIVKKYRNQPNLLAWYINDELGLGKLPAIQKRYEQVKTIDSNHPVFQVNDKIDILPFFYNSYDIIGTDPYPVENKQTLEQVSHWTMEAMAGSQQASGVWQVLQLHDLSFHQNKTNRPPTLEEMRNMSYQALIGGAKGIFYFAYHWLYYKKGKDGKSFYSEEAFNKRWPDVSSLVAEINEVVPAIVEGQRVQLDSRSDRIVLAAWEYKDRLYIMLANPDNQQRALQIKLPYASRVEETYLSPSELVVDREIVDISLGAFGSGVLVINRVQ